MSVPTKGTAFLIHRISKSSFQAKLAGKNFGESIKAYIGRIKGEFVSNSKLYDY